MWIPLCVCVCFFLTICLQTACRGLSHGSIWFEVEPIRRVASLIFSHRSQNKKNRKQTWLRRMIDRQITGCSSSFNQSTRWIYINLFVSTVGIEKTCWIKSLVVDRSHIKEWEIIIPQATVLFCFAPIWSKSSHNASVPRWKPGGQQCAETQQQPSPNWLTEPSHETSWLTSGPPPQCFSWVRGRKVWVWTDLGDNGAAWVRGTDVWKARSPLTQGPGTNGPYRWARVRSMLPQMVWFPLKCSTNAEFWTTKKAAFKVE